jgi:mannose/fructose/N-acetylgalactosamine-specific phosphotransferase system component IID
MEYLKMTTMLRGILTVFLFLLAACAYPFGVIWAAMEIGFLAGAHLVHKVAAPEGE